jgi:signal transduction histidine kinase
MIQLIDEILFLGKTDADTLKYQPAPLDLENFCHELAETMQASAESTITFRCEGKRTQAEMDAFLLQLILTNLLSNAIKYSPPRSKVQFNLTYQNATALFQIQDRGIGIPLKDQEQLFDTFYRASNVGQTQGTGLGLSIVKKCVELHGGRISVNSEVGVGTTFTVTLPLNSRKSDEV